MSTLAIILTIAASFVTILGAAAALGLWLFARGKNEGIVEQSAIKRVPQLENIISNQGDRISRMHSDYRDLKERVSVLDERKASKDNIPALRVPTGWEWDPVTGQPRKPQ